MKENLKSLFEGCWTVPNLLSLIRILGRGRVGAFRLNRFL